LPHAVFLHYNPLDYPAKRTKGIRRNNLPPFRRHKPLNFQNFQSENITAAYITSTELVQSLFAQVPPQFSRFFKSLLYFTHHPRIAEALKREGVRSVETVPSLEYALSHFPV